MPHYSSYSELDLGAPDNKFSSARHLNIWLEHCWNGTTLCATGGEQLWALVEESASSSSSIYFATFENQIADIYNAMAGHQKNSSSTSWWLCSRFCSPDLASYDDLLAEADTRLFSRISTNSLHVLYDLLPPPSTASQHYSLRERSHISHYLTAPLTLPIPTSSPDVSSTTVSYTHLTLPTIYSV